MAKILKWRVSISLLQTAEGSYSTDTLGETTLTVPNDSFKEIGQIVQAHAQAINVTAEATSHPALREAIRAEA